MIKVFKAKNMYYIKVFPFGYPFLEAETLDGTLIP